MTLILSTTRCSNCVAVFGSLPMLLTLLFATACDSRNETTRLHNDSSNAVNGSAAVSAIATTAVGSTPALDTIRSAMARHQLTVLDSTCLQLESETALAPLVSYTVRERHTGKCAGDPNTAPRLFRIAVDTLTWIVSTDARSTTATMQQLRRP